MDYNKLSFITLPMGARLGVYLGNTVIVFNLPDLKGMYKEGCIIFGDRSFGPSNTWAEETAKIIASNFHREDARSELIACRFSHNRIGTAKIGTLARWSTIEGFRSLGLDATNPPAEVMLLQDLLLLHVAGEVDGKGVTRPVFHFYDEFSDSKCLEGEFGPTGFTGGLTINSVVTPINGRGELVRLSDPDSYLEVHSERVVLELGGTRISLSHRDAEGIGNSANRALDALDLHLVRHVAVNRLHPNVPKLIAYLEVSSQTELERMAPTESDVSVSSRDRGVTNAVRVEGEGSDGGGIQTVRTGADDLGRVKTVFDIGAQLEPIDWPTLIQGAADLLP